MTNLVIHDIFPPVDVPDNSAYIFFSLLFAGVLSTSFVVYVLYKKFKVHKNRRVKKYIEILHNCDFKNVKQSAYQISYYGHLLAKTDQEKAALKEIVSELSLHQYKKEMPEISEEVIEQFQLFLITVEHRYV
ncbi:hypothetical protein [Sulfurovum sp. TSL1]|uniref:hypothetical protein n=1 Tax=Sulfurovum sp. TSL1 TaxID=2826994 RepID=UPI001CC51663|nr:hypothetical protein [Sulfurovum sp. TSL1]GIT97206.1 hypothetical protein TSL1_00270 [Sulfurovum sp. TSL1]